MTSLQHVLHGEYVLQRAFLHLQQRSWHVHFAGRMRKTHWANHDDALAAHKIRALQDELTEERRALEKQVEAENKQQYASNFDGHQGG